MCGQRSFDNIYYQDKTEDELWPRKPGQVSRDLFMYLEMFMTGVGFFQEQKSCLSVCVWCGVARALWPPWEGALAWLSPAVGHHPCCQRWLHFSGAQARS